MNEIQPLVTINAQTFTELYHKVLFNIVNKGVTQNPDYNISTKRIYLSFFVSDVNSNQVSPLCPIKENGMKVYKDELTEEYANWYVSLPNDDKRKFDYCYAKQLFLYGSDKMNTLEANLKNLRVGSRRHCGTLWENNIHINKLEDQPCWVFYKLELLNETDLLVYITYRSWDAYGGLPCNLPAITHGIQTKIKDLNLPYKIVGFFGTGYDTHIYETDMNAAKEITKNFTVCVRCGEVVEKKKTMLNSKGTVCAGCMR